jgi:ABC-type polysaccharide/polyol phosphate transport system ATPase subunit
MSESVIHVERVSKRFRIGKVKGSSTLRDALANVFKAPFRPRDPDEDTILWALRDISFEVKQGEVVGLVGRNGAGKSTLLKILARITRPTSGSAELRGRVGSLLEVGTGFHHELSGRENVFLTGSVLGMKKAEIGRRFDEIVAFSEVERFLDTPLKHYSSGMQMRLAFAVAAHLEPEILLVDEVLAVGDAAFQKKCLGKMRDIASHGRTILFVSHHSNQIRRLCGRAIWFDAGMIRMDGFAHQVVNEYESSLSRGGRDPATSLDTGATSHAGQATGDSGFLKWEIVEAGDNPHVLDRIGPVTVTFSLEVRRPIERGHYGIALRNRDQQLMWAWALDPFSLEIGQHRFTHTFPMLPLRPGLYNWLVTVYDQGTLLDWWDAVPEMSVETEVYQHPRDEWNGVLNLPSKFKLEAQMQVEATNGSKG